MVWIEKIKECLVRLILYNLGKRCKFKWNNMVCENAHNRLQLFWDWCGVAVKQHHCTITSFFFFLNGKTERYNYEVPFIWLLQWLLLISINYSALSCNIETYKEQEHVPKTWLGQGKRWYINAQKFQAARGETRKLQY